MATNDEIRAKDIIPHKTSFDPGDGFYGDGDSSFFMEADTLLELTAQNALAGNVAPAFDPTKPNDVDGYAYYEDDIVVYNGVAYKFKVNHPSGAWNPVEVELTNASEYFAKKEITDLVQLLPVSLDVNPTSYDVEYTNGVLKTNGDIQEVSGFRTTDIIEVSKQVIYQMVVQGVNTGYAQIAMYDKNQRLISTVRLDSTSNEVGFVFDSSVKFFRCSVKTSTSLKYRRADDSIFFEVSADYSVNLFDPSKATENVYINSSGAEVSFSGGSASDYIPVVGGNDYAIGFSFGGSTARTAFYSVAKTFISSEPASASSVTAPSSAKFMRVSFLTSDIKKVTVSKGTNALPQISIPYGAVQFDPRQNFLSPAPYVAADALDYNDGVSFVDGIFEQESSSSYKTSDYINIAVSGGVESEVYLKFNSTYTSYFSVVRFYDKDYNETGRIIGGAPLKIGVVYKVTPPANSVYLKFSQITSTLSSCGFGKIKSGVTFESMCNGYFAKNNNILWIGTSIPEGAKYPIEASKACGYSCTNKSLGSSMLGFTGVHPQTVKDWSGRCLTATVAELESLYRQDVTDGIITEDRLNQWKNYSYENSIIPYIDGTNNTQVSAIVLDHGFNDRTSIHSLMANPSGIDWSSTDRSNFVGAFNYLYKKILEANPFVKIIISGYFQNVYADYYSKDICDMQELIAEKYDLQLMPAWKFSGINFEYVPGSSDYISDFNSTYGTSYTKMNQDGNGNIPLFQFFCPDKVHPHSDKTGNCDRILNAVYTKLLRNSL